MTQAQGQTSASRPEPSAAVNRGLRLVPSSYRSALRDRAFVRLLPGFATSSLGDGMSAVSVAWLAVQIAPRGRAGILVAVSLAAFELPAVVGGLGLARWFGHRSGRFLLTANCLLRGVFLGAAAALAAAHLLNPVLYVVLLAFSSIMYSWGRAGQTALIVQLLSADARLAANALLGSLGSVAMIAGPALAGVLAAACGARVPVAADALSYFILALNLQLVPARREAPGQAVKVKSGLGALSGLRELLSAPDIRRLLLLTTGMALLYGPFEAALPVLVTMWPHGGAAALGTLWSFFGVGALVGSLLVGFFRSVPVWPAAVVIAAIWGCTTVSVGLSTSVLGGAVALLVAGTAYAPYPPLSMTYLQNAIAEETLPRAAAAWGSAITVAGPLGYLIGAPAIALLGARDTILASGIAILGLVAVVGLTSSRITNYPAVGAGLRR
jgi:hypothetical protein